MTHQPDHITVICPKHGEHEHAITSNIPGHEGVWCQICWIESMGPSLPYRKSLPELNPIQPDSLESDSTGFQTMEETIPIPDESWKTLPKE